MARTESCGVELSMRGCPEPFGAPTTFGASDRDSRIAAGSEADTESEVTDLKAKTSLPRGRRRRAGGCDEQGTRLPGEMEEEVQKLPSRKEVWMQALLFFICVLVAMHFCYHWLTQEGEYWRWGCRQCKKEWWRDFWRWRLELGTRPDLGFNESDSHGFKPPPGMDWNWGSSKSVNDTDWWAASAELVNEVVVPHVDAGLGPVLQVGCGDSPLPAFLHKAGFVNSEHIDIEPRVVATMQERYPEASWPGVHFEERDFLAHSSSGGGPPPPLHRFAAVIDKAGIWDWLLEEKPSLVPRLLSAVADALVLVPRPGAYVVATKQKPSELQATLADKPGFVVMASRPLLSSSTLGASAWAYVLVPAPITSPKDDASPLE